MFRPKRIYLDHASATPTHPAALGAMQKGSQLFANPGGLHADSVQAKRALERARARIASYLACKSREVIFTSGLTEGNAIAIIGAARALERTRRSLKGTHWIVSSIEHSSVLECFAEVERMGGEVSYVEPETTGLISAEKVATLLKPGTVFVSVGWANNEIGTLQPLSRIAAVIRAHEHTHKTTVLFHTDAGQAPLYAVPHVHTLNVDLCTFGSGKLYGPRGIGALYISTRTELAPVIFGGGQERGLRPGTEDTALALGFAEAFTVISTMRKAEVKRVRTLRDELVNQLQKRYPDIVINGDLRRALPNLLNISIPGDQTGEYLALRFDHFGIALSTKSACKEGEAASHVVSALVAAATSSGAGVSATWRATNTLRFSLGTSTTPGDIKQVLMVFDKVLKQASPKTAVHS